MAVWAEGDEVLVLVLLALFPRDDVMYIDLNMAAGGNRAAVTGFNQHTS